MAGYGMGQMPQTLKDWSEMARVHGLGERCLSHLCSEGMHIFKSEKSSLSPVLFSAVIGACRADVGEK